MTFTKNPYIIFFPAYDRTIHFILVHYNNIEGRKKKVFPSYPVKHSTSHCYVDLKERPWHDVWSSSAIEIGIDNQSNSFFFRIFLYWNLLFLYLYKYKETVDDFCLDLSNEECYFASMNCVYCCVHPKNKQKCEGFLSNIMNSIYGWIVNVVKLVLLYYIVWFLCVHLNQWIVYKIMWNIIVFK